MTIDVFAEKVKECVEEKLGEDYKIKICSVNKNNGIIYTGVCISKDNVTVSPVIYLDGHYEMYEKGNATIESVAAYAIGVYSSDTKGTKIDVRQFLQYENIRDRIVYKLVNTERNKELLKDVPHMKFLDMSIVFQCLIEQKDFGTASVLIHNAHMKLWNVSVENLYQSAKENTKRLEKYEIKSMSEILRDLMKAEEPEEYNDEDWKTEFSDDIPMYVLSNSCRVGGAACILYPLLLADIAKQLGKSFYIIPSSIHEVLIIPADNMDESKPIQNMIKEVNDTQVRPEEVLSYSLYYYDRDEDKISVCA